MKPDDLEAWTPVEPPAGFAERVVAAAQLEPDRSPRVARRQRIASGIALVAAFAASVAVLFARRRAEPVGDVAADARREVHVGPRAVAVLEPGAEVRWRGAEVEQASGDVFWRVEPGGPFAVKTPGGQVNVKGTCFRVKVTATLAAGAAIAVAVYEGRVVVSRGPRSVELAAGQAAEANERGVEPVREDPSSAQPAASAAPAEHAVAVLDRARADKMRDDLRRLFAEAGPAWTARAEPDAAVAVQPRYGTMPVVPDDGGGSRVDPQYVQRVVHQDFFPLARQCYDVAAAKNPTLAGTIELKFRIMGDPSIGGVVGEATLGDKTTIADSELQTCMKESMMSITFAAPPRGGEVTVTYPVEFSPDDPDGG